jgi:hypothetical protein
MICSSVCLLRFIVRSFLKARLQFTSDQFNGATSLRDYLYGPRKLFDDDIVADGQAKPGALSRGFSREEGIEHFLLYVGRNARAVVANRDLYAVAEVLRLAVSVGSYPSLLSCSLRLAAA